VTVSALALALISSIALMVSKFGVHRTLSITGVTFLSVFAAHGVTAIPWSIGWVGGDYYLYPTPSPNYPWVVATSLVGFLVGALAAARLQSFDLRVAQTTFAAQRLARGRVSFLALTITIVVVAFLAIWLTLLPAAAAILTLAGRSPEAITQFRSNSGAVFGLIAYPLSIFATVIGPLLLLTAINVARTSLGAERRASLLMIGALSLALLLAAASTLQRAPIVMLFLFVMASFYLSSRRYPAVDRRIAVGAVAVVLVVGTAAYVATTSLNVFDSVRFVFDRVFIIPQQALDAFLHVYPYEIPYSGGLGVGLFARIAGVADYQMPALLVGYMSTGSPRVDLDCFWACDLWANFGYLGVVIGSVFVGALVVSLDRWCLRMMKRTAVGSALYAFMLVQSIQMVHLSIFTMLLSGGFVIAPFIAWLLERPSIGWPRRTRSEGGAIAGAKDRDSTS
jgi:hypothetical protein